MYVHMYICISRRDSSVAKRHSLLEALGFINSRYSPHIITERERGLSVNIKKLLSKILTYSAKIAVLPAAPPPPLQLPHMTVLLFVVDVCVVFCQTIWEIRILKVLGKGRDGGGGVAGLSTPLLASFLELWVRRR